MKTLNREPDVHMFKVNSKIVGSFVITSMLLSNNVSSVHWTYQLPKPTVIRTERSTNIYTPSKWFNYGMVKELSGYTSINKDIIGEDTIFINNEKIFNINKLKAISTLPDNWNENGAKAISSTLINRVKGYINFLEIQPEIFPTVMGTLQLEYDRENGAHLEIEISENEDADIFIMAADDSVSTYKVAVNVEEINKVVRKFYG